MISKKLQDALNAQINAEMWSAYLYLSMSVEAESKGLKGFGNWFFIQFREEQDHARILMNYLLARGGQELSPALSQSIFAMPKDEGKAYVIGSDHDNAALAVLQKIGENEQASGDQYKTFINSQMVQIKSGEANSVLYKGARELQKITYNDDAIKMVIQQDSVDK